MYSKKRKKCIHADGVYEYWIVETCCMGKGQFGNTVILKIIIVNCVVKIIRCDVSYAIKNVRCAVENNQLWKFSNTVIFKTIVLSYALML